MFSKTSASTILSFAGTVNNVNDKPLAFHIFSPFLELSSAISLTEPIKRIEGTVTLPGSKSLSNRILLLSALSTGVTRVTNLLSSDDISYMLRALDTLGVDVTVVSDTEVVVKGLTGEGDPGCPPVSILPTSTPTGGTASISGKMSSQFLSALLMASPLASSAVKIEVKDELISAPYVSLTIGLMSRFGMPVEISGDMSSKPTFSLTPSTYTSPKEILVEGDASSASYFLAGAAITGGTVTVVGCGSKSVQGDVKFANCLEEMGADVTWGDDCITVSREQGKKLKGGVFDCLEIPDAAMTLAVVAMFAEGPTEIRNVYSWRLKETERMKAICAECTKLGARVEEFRDYCVIHPPARMNEGVSVETYDDHRMAMAFSLAACGGVNVTIEDPKCTGKTFPDYFEVLESVTVR
ncbi:hypothetical protein TrRE_jg4199 [Triparma retinervis]|uniref:3-phosphoshikimate 1-carboxyvinyltransferase n=1 Tax=Triparma retinervis TaxID=2557542 RepID=A0A9W6Z831_9STRA|nr:hypothetical protein TrRE_jg4199 [Triparma retinervis]